MSEKLNNIIIDKRIENKKIKRVENYVDAKTKINFKCLICNYTWKTLSHNIFENHGCPKCSNKLKLTNELIDEKLKCRNIKRIGKCKGGKTKIEFLCEECHCRWEAKPNNVLCGTGCPNCNLVHHDNEFIDNQLKNRNIKRLDDYINANTPIKFQCKLDGHIWKVAPNNIIRKHKSGCPLCANQIVTNQDIDDYLKSSSIKRVGNYINAHTKIEFECQKCNLRVFVSPCNIKHGVGCAKCSLGKNENKIFNLINNIIKYDYFKPHKTFYFNNRKYIPDFYLEIKNTKIIVEYNGEQHYKPVKFGSMTQEIASKKFEKQKIRDTEMRIYCKENAIILLEIPYYWEEEKIIRELNILNFIN